MTSEQQSKTPFILIWISLVAVVVAVAFVHHGVREDARAARDEISALRDSVKRLRREADSLKDQVPGLGEYMTTNQLHLAKLWFAARAQNWDLARYEVDELDETMQAAEGLHAVKHGVDISGVLESVRQSQMAVLRQSIGNKDASRFAEKYADQMEACNACHRASGYAFIRIAIPGAPPVSNQIWTASQKK